MSLRGRERTGTWRRSRPWPRIRFWGFAVSLSSVVHRPNPVDHGPHIANLRVVRRGTLNEGLKIGHRFPVLPNEKVNHAAIVNLLPRRGVNCQGHFNHHEDFGEILAAEVGALQIIQHAGQDLFGGRDVDE